MERITSFYKVMYPYVQGLFTDWLEENGFFIAPASVKYHGNYEGGLFDHSLSVAQILVELTEKNSLVWQKERSPYLVGMFHDLCKTDQYQHPIIGENLGGEKIYDKTTWEHRIDTLLTGHGEKSVMLLSQFYTLTEEEVACIRYHMGAFTDKSEWQQYTEAVKSYNNVLWTHQADMIASHIKGV